MCEYGYLVMAPEFHLGLCFIVSLHNPSKGCSRQYGKSGKLNMVPHARSKNPFFSQLCQLSAVFRMSSHRWLEYEWKNGLLETINLNDIVLAFFSVLVADIFLFHFSFLAFFPKWRLKIISVAIGVRLTILDSKIKIAKLSCAAIWAKFMLSC